MVGALERSAGTVRGDADQRIRLGTLRGRARPTVVAHAMPLIYCRGCLVPNTRPNGRFGDDGLCSACAFAGSNDHVDFELRLDELRKLVAERTVESSSRRWQCIVGVSGGKDSTRQALWVRERLGLRPLLVSVAYPPRQISQVGVDNLSNLISLGFDRLVLGPAPRLSRELVREAFFRFCNWCKATELALFAGVPQIAVEKKIPLILWGENPALQVGDSATLGDSMWDGSNLVESNTLAGGDLSWFLEVAGDERRLSPYVFPTKEELVDAGVSTVFLGPAWRDYTTERNSTVAITNGLSVRPDVAEHTGDMFGTSMVDEDWTIVNNLLKYYKLGFARGTDQAGVLIRRGEITREQGIAIAEAYDGACGQHYLDSFCEYIGLSEDEFWATVRRFADPELFDLSGERPVKRFTVGVGLP